ncbi:MAG TPA: ubiquitin-conjugating enzyme E2 [Saprospiraceae bacterium]|nr:ubiquitin-conjugating enzyme E2 [Saprospiraceae bacterium]
MASKRLDKEFEKVSAEYDVERTSDKHWQLALLGPDDTPYFGGTYLIDITFPKDYPFSPPSITFLTKIYHPNINHKGEICMEILKDGWNPSHTLGDIMSDIQLLLKTPKPDDPLVTEIANQYKKDRGAYIKKAEEVTQKYAI